MENKQEEINKLLITNLVLLRIMHSNQMMIMDSDKLDEETRAKARVELENISNTLRLVDDLLNMFIRIESINNE